MYCMYIRLIEDWYGGVLSHRWMRGAKKVTCVTYSSITRSIQKSKSKIIKKKLVSVSEQGQLIAFFRDAPRISSCMQKISERNRNGNIAANRYRQLNVACVVHCIRSIQAITRTTGGGGRFGGVWWPMVDRTQFFPALFFFFRLCVFSNRGQFGDWDLGDFPLFLCCKEFRRTKSNPFNRSYIKYKNKIQHACCLVLYCKKKKSCMYIHTILCT